MTEPTRSNDYWHSRPNTRNNPFSDDFFRHGDRMHRFLRRVSNVDFPDRLELPHDRPIVFAANHRSFLDIVVAGALFSHFELTCRFQVQARMFSKPVIGPWLTQLGCIPTNTKTREQSERTSIESLEAGHTIAVMPEGRLVPPADRPQGVGPGRPGMGRVVAKTGAVVIPTACSGTSDVWPRGRPIPRLGLRNRPTVRVTFGEPMEFEGDDHQANVDAVMDEIAAMLAGDSVAPPS